jgi:GNAT superfamily N-acetyltransferase
VINILPFAGKYQEAVEELVLPIQQIEFGFSVTREDQPDLLDIAGVFQRGAGNFWVALDNDRVVGTVGVVDICNQQLALKKMFVASEFRGKEMGIGQALLDTALAWSRQKGIKQILLGSTAPMKAAHRFYEKNGFIPVDKEELPSNFPIVHVDSKFYRYDV